MTDSAKIRLTSKKLPSGRFQVQFSVGHPERFYGYVLADAKTPLSDVMRKIGRHVSAAGQPERYFQANLFSLLKRNLPSGKIVVFKR